MPDQPLSEKQKEAIRRIRLRQERLSRTGGLSEKKDTSPEHSYSSKMITEYNGKGEKRNEYADEAVKEIITWEKTYGGSANDSANSIIQTTDGGYALSGGTYNKDAGGMNAWLIKLDSCGNVIWKQTYSGSVGDCANMLIQTTDGGYTLTGYKYIKGAGDEDAWLIKLDSRGNIIWEKTYGWRHWDMANSLIQTIDGGYALAGYNEINITAHRTGGIDAWLIKLDSRGELTWKKIYGGSEDDLANSLIQTTDDGYALAGWTKSIDDSRRHAWMLKLDSRGNKTWDKTYGGSIEGEIFSLIQTSDSGYALAGYAVLEGFKYIYVIKTDRQGNVK